MLRRSGGKDLRRWTVGVSAVFFAPVSISEPRNIVDSHAMAAVEAQGALHVDDFEDTPYDIGDDGFRAPSESESSTDDEGWEDEVEELNDNAGSR